MIGVDWLADPGVDGDVNVVGQLARVPTAVDRGDHDDRDVLQVGICRHLAGEIHTFQGRGHHYVEQNHVGLVLHHGVPSLGSICCCGNPIPLLGEDGAGDLDKVGIVVHDQDVGHCFLRDLDHLLGPQIDEPVGQPDKSYTADDVANRHRQQVPEKESPPGQGAIVGRGLANGLPERSGGKAFDQ